MLEEFMEVGHLNIPAFFTISIRVKKNCKNSWRYLNRLMLNYKVWQNIKKKLNNEPEFLEPLVEAEKKRIAKLRKKPMDTFWRDRKLANFFRRVKEYRGHYEKLLKEQGIEVDLATLEKESETFIPFDLLQATGPDIYDIYKKAQEYSEPVWVIDKETDTRYVYEGTTTPSPDHTET